MLTLAGGEYIGGVESEAVLDGLIVSLRRMRGDPAPIRDSDHAHDDDHLMLVIDAGYRSSATGAPASSRGSLLVYNPAGTVHRDHFEQTGGRFLAITVSPVQVAAFSEIAPLPKEPVTLTGVAANSQSRRLAAAMARGKLDDLELEHACLELLASIEDGVPSPGRKPPSWLDRALEALGDQPEVGAVRVADAARAAGVHPVYFARAFRRHVGCAPGDIARRHRVDRAAAMMRRGRRDLAQIAHQLGYADQSHFTNDFGRQYGCSPSVYARAF